MFKKQKSVPGRQRSWGRKDINSSKRKFQRQKLFPLQARVRCRNYICRLWSLEFVPPPECTALWPPPSQWEPAATEQQQQQQCHNQCTTLNPVEVVQTLTCCGNVIHNERAVCEDICRKSRRLFANNGLRTLGGRAVNLDFQLDRARLNFSIKSTHCA